MEKLSFQSSYSQVSLYARLTTASGTAAPGATAKKADDGATPGTDGKAPAGEQRNADGDSFTLSIEARTMQVSESVTVEESGDAQAAQSASTDKLGGAIDSFLDAFDKVGGKGSHHKRHHHFPQLGDAEDVAGQAMQHVDKEHSGKDCSRSEFADEIKGRLASWKATKSVSVEYTEFREQVSISLSSSLDAWAQGNTNVTPGAAAPAGTAVPADGGGAGAPAANGTGDTQNPSAQS